MNTEEFLSAQLERLFEIAGAYVMADAHIETDGADKSDEISTMMKAIGFDDTDGVDILMLVGAKSLVSFYAVMRDCFDAEVVDQVWRIFVQLNAEHRNEMAVKRTDDDKK